MYILSNRFSFFLIFVSITTYQLQLLADIINYRCSIPFSSSFIQSNLFPAKGYCSWFFTRNSFYLNEKEYQFYSRSACVKKKPFDSKFVYSNMFLLKKILITADNYCAITNHYFFYHIHCTWLDNMLNLWRKKTIEKNVLRS